MTKVKWITSAQLLALAVTWSVSAVQAATLSSWDTTGATGSEATWAGVGSPNVTPAPLSRGAGITPSSASNNFGATGFTQEATDYFELGLTIAPGYQAALDDLYIATRSSGTGPGSVGLYASLNNFATAGTLVTTFAQSGTTYLNSIVDLSSLGPVAGTLTFRLYQIGTSSANGGTSAAAGTFRIGDYFDGSYSPLQVTGTVAAVPEPSAMLLLSVGGLSLLALSRRRRAM
jgi:hypothetical protein